MQKNYLFRQPAMIRKSIFLLLLIVWGEASAQPVDEPHQTLDDIFTIGTVQSLMIEKENQLIYHSFRNGMDRQTTTNIKSASKSVLSLLIGIAVEERFIEGIDDPISSYFQSYFSDHPSPEKEAITIKDLLTMRSGLETTSFRNYGAWVLSDNWTEFVLRQPMVDTPGGKMIYSTGSSHLLSVILTKTTGMSTKQFAEKYLFGPMSIRVGGWDRDPQGYYMGGNNLALSPLALLKLGRLMLNNGLYNGDQLVPEEWIKQSTEIYTKSRFNNYDYGYMWWSKTVGDQRVIFAWGNSGQYIMILPALDAVISITSAIGGSRSRDYQRRIFEFLEQRILPRLQLPPDSQR
ncbi:MAG: serine hydrolase [Bacteroidetes bacterium]|nr:serine hydrolase [Bacteroidota bacterium]